MPSPKTALPKRLADAIAHSARPGKGDDARKAAAQLVKAREAGNLKDARKAAIKAKLVAPRSAWVREQLGLLAFDLEDLHEATQELMAYRRQGKPARALDLLTELKRQDVSTKTWVDAQIARARALADTGRADTAFTFLKEAARDAGPKDRPRLLEAMAEL